MPATPAVPTQKQGEHGIRIEYLPQNTVGRDLVVGDLHGCRALFDRALETLRFDPATDRVLSVGDLVDRGPDSPGCLALLREPWFHAVTGNHEAMLVARFLSEDGDIGAHDMHRLNGGNWFHGPRQLQEDPALTPLLTRAAELPHLLVVGSGRARYHLVHAELPAGQTTPMATDVEIDDGLPRANADTLIWTRQLMSGRATRIPRRQRGLSTTYCGHTPEPKVRRRRSHVCLDTGACFGVLDATRSDFALSIAERSAHGDERVHRFGT